MTKYEDSAWNAIAYHPLGKMEMFRLSTTCILVGLLVSGCKLEASSRLYVSDVVEVSDTGQPVSTPITIAIEVPTAESCQRDAKNMVSKIKIFDDTVDHIGCEKRGLDDYAIFKASALVYKFGTDPKARSLLKIMVGSNTSLTKCNGMQDSTVWDGVCNWYGFEMKLNYDFEIMRKTVVTGIDSMHADWKIDASTFKIVLDNDSKGSVKLLVNEAFVDNKPVSRFYSTNDSVVPRRQNLEVRLTNVASALILENGKNEDKTYYVGAIGLQRLEKSQ